MFARRSSRPSERGVCFHLTVSAGLVAMGLSCLPAVAQTTDDAYRVEAQGAPHASGLIDDIKAFATAPVRWRGREWMQLGAVAAAVGTAYQYDNRARSHFVTGSEPNPAVRDYENPQDAAPALLAVGGTWLAATLADSDAGRQEAASMLRAALFAATSAEVLKTAFGRERPGPGTPRNSWRNGGGRSFPSGHTAFASAIGTVLAESGDNRHRWIRRTLGYGLAIGTAYERVKHDSHWLSDTVAGAGLGIATGRFIVNRREISEARAEVSLAPFDGGAMLTYTVPIRR